MNLRVLSGRSKMYPQVFVCIVFLRKSNAQIAGYFLTTLSGNAEIAGKARFSSGVIHRLIHSLCGQRDPAPGCPC
jgi:hypothetical protein